MLIIRDAIGEPPVALAAFDICLLTSIAEGTSIVVLESQWIGTPVIATAGGGTQELLDIGASGWLIDLVDADTIANVVLRVLADFKMQINGIRKSSAFHRIAVRHGSNDLAMQLYGLAPKTASVRIWS